MTLHMVNSKNKKVLIFFDTNTLESNDSNLYLKGKHFKSNLALAKAYIQKHNLTKKVCYATSEICINEIQRHIKQNHRIISQNITNFSILNSHFLKIKPIMIDQKELDSKSKEIIDSINKEITIIPIIKKYCDDELYTRAIDKIIPLDSSKASLKDTLIWLNVRDYLSSQNSDPKKAFTHLLFYSEDRVFENENEFNSQLKKSQVTTNYVNAKDTTQFEQKILSIFEISEVSDKVKTQIYNLCNSQKTYLMSEISRKEYWAYKNVYATVINSTMRIENIELIHTEKNTGNIYDTTIEIVISFQLETRNYTIMPSISVYDEMNQYLSQITRPAPDKEIYYASLTAITEIDLDTHKLKVLDLKQNLLRIGNLRSREVILFEKA